jgi:hypothetical protein
MTSEKKYYDDRLAQARHGSRLRRAAVVAGLAASAALLCAAAVPAHASTATTPAATPHASGVSEHATASAGDASTAAQRAVAYWTRSRMLSARNGSTVKGGSAPGAHAAPTHASGPAGHVAGAAPSQSIPGASHRAATPARLGARPMYGSIATNWTGNFYLPPSTTTGIVFFTTRNGQNWWCAGSTVNTNGKDSVITAGQCVYGNLGGSVPGEGWHSNVVFVPDYDNGWAPYGVWTARQLWTLTNYVNYQDAGDSIGAAVLNTNGYGQHIVNVVGGQGFSWNWPASEYVYVFGETGSNLVYCSNYEFGWYSSTIGVACNYNNAGDPWLMSFNGEFGYINGVTSAYSPSLPGDVLSAYFGTNAENLYYSINNL